jgi:hypothetical protein
MTAWYVTVSRGGVSPLRLELLVRAPSREAAGELASAVAERDRGGIFEAKRVRRAPAAAREHHPRAYDAA